VVLVAVDRLGAIHQVLVTAEAIKRRGLMLAAVVLNQLDPALDPRLDNAAELAHWLGMAVIALPHQAGAGPLPQLAALAEKLAHPKLTLPAGGARGTMRPSFLSGRPRCATTAWTTNGAAPPP